MYEKVDCLWRRGRGVELVCGSKQMNIDRDPFEQYDYFLWIRIYK